MIDFSGNSYEQIKARMMSIISNNIDKRETSMVGLAIEPIAIELSTIYDILNLIQNNSWILTAEGSYLDNKCLERGIVRKQATKAIKQGSFNIPVSKDTNFSTIGYDNPLVYKTIEDSIEQITYLLNMKNYSIGTLEEKSNFGYYYATDNETFYYDGIEIEVERVSELPEPSLETLDKYYLNENNLTLYLGEKQVLYNAKMECQTEGTIGNSYSGNILPMVNIQNLTYAYIGELILVGTDVENDVSLRARYLASLDSDSFAGNIQAYRNYTLSINGVGGVQVYPHYKGPGTVKLSIIDSEYNQATEALIELVQNTICPPETGDNEPSPLGYGMAPIGAKVDVGTSTDLSIDLSFDVELTSGTEVADIQSRVETIYEEYLLKIRQGWGNALISNKIQYLVSVYISQITSELLKIEEILNITNMKLNNEASDIHCIEAANYSVEPSVDIQQLPIKGNVSITKIN